MGKDNIKLVQAWAITNPKACVLIGIVIIGIGLTVDLLYENTHSIFWFIIAHLSIILGEAVTVTFFLHLFVEQQHAEQSSKLLVKLGNEGKAILEEQAKFIGDEFKNLIVDLKKQADETISNINENLFAAILKDKMPHQIVTAVLDSKFFNTELLRRDLKLTFDIKSIVDDKLKLTQRTEFDMEYIFGNKQEYEYKMPITISNTPLASYVLKETGYKRYMGKNDWQKYKINQGLVRSGDNYVLENPISIAKNEKIKVYQDVEAIYSVGKDGIVDNYFVNHHTINMRVVITNLPEEYEFKPYPTFPSNKFKHPQETGMIISYDNIEFLVPGQGFGFSISKK